MQPNTPELWDGLWKETSETEDAYRLALEENGVRWQRIEQLILARFGAFKDLRVIEVGAGAGTNALLFGKRGATITILDYSKKALERSKEFFARNRCKAEYILADALALPEELLGQYDVSMSFGLAEHFQGRERTRIIRSHCDLINKSGMTLVSVPNKYNIPYRMFMFASKVSRTWQFGEEYPFSRKELGHICRTIGIPVLRFVGDSFWSSFRFIKLFSLFMKRDMNVVRKEKGSWLDEYLGYSLVLTAGYTPAG
jgi:SAM-dependent methyltransferase